MKWTDFLEIWYLSKFHDYNMSDIVNFARSVWNFFLKSFHFNDIFLFLKYERYYWIQFDFWDFKPSIQGCGNICQFFSMSFRYSFDIIWSGDNWQVFKFFTIWIFGLKLPRCCVRRNYVDRWVYWWVLREFSSHFAKVHRFLHFKFRNIFSWHYHCFFLKRANFCRYRSQGMLRPQKKY